MTEPPNAPALTDSWEGILEALRRRFPGQRDSVLFCLHKLQQNPELTLPDFRDEAALHGIPVAGRALFSARVLLGLQAAEPKAPAATKAQASPRAILPTARGADPDAEPTPRSRRRRVRRGETPPDGPTIEERVLAAMQQIRSTASEDAEQLRAAIRQAIAVLQRALER